MSAVFQEPFLSLRRQTSDEVIPKVLFLLWNRTAPAGDFPSETVGFDAVAEVLSLLKSYNLSDDERLASILWLIPASSMAYLAPKYLQTAIHSVSPVLKILHNFLIEQSVNEECLEDIKRAPVVTQSIVCAYLFVWFRHNPDINGKDLLRNLLALAQTFTCNPHDTTGDKLLCAVKERIHACNLAVKLLPEETWIWKLEPAQTWSNLSGMSEQDALKHLEDLIRKLWLTTGFVQESEKPALYVACLPHLAGIPDGAVDRLMTSLAIRFSKLFMISKVKGKADAPKIPWSRSTILSWHEGLHKQALQKKLLMSSKADPVEIAIPSASDAQAQLDLLVATTSLL